MSTKDRRQYFRINDRVYFEYKVIYSNENVSENKIFQQLLGENGACHIEASKFFHEIDEEINRLTRKLGSQYADILPIFNLLNKKVDYLCRAHLSKNQAKLKPVSISMASIAFSTAQKIAEHAHIAIIMYAKPELIPLFLEGNVVYSQKQRNGEYRTAIEFNSLTEAQENLLAQHIMLAQPAANAG